MTLDTSISSLHRVGKTVAKRFERLGIRTVRDLLFHFPFRYEDFRRVVPIRDIVKNPAAFDRLDVTIQGSIELIVTKRSPRKRMMITEAIVSDGTKQMRIVWFGQPFIGKVLQSGDQVYLSGAVKSDMFGASMVSPAYEKVRREGGTTHTARLVPMYPLTGGLTQKQVRFLVSQALPLVEQVSDWLPEEIRRQVNVLPLWAAMSQIHFPETDEARVAAERRLKFDELFLLQLRAEMIRQALVRSVAPVLSFQEEETKRFVEALPWPLTQAQRVATWDILKDVSQAQPMNRLLEGDVGSGKTVVAAIAAHTAILNGYQVAILAPTEILAKQHIESFAAVFKSIQIRIGLFTRSQRLITDTLIHDNRENTLSDIRYQTSEVSREVSKQQLLKDIQQGVIQIVIGTHALLSETVNFKKLGLVIIDEQHRFGVEQRKGIRDKSGLQDLTPHLLSMTATPIPRSLALTLYGDLELSILNELPPGRKPIKTRVVAPHNRVKAYAFVREQVKQGRQVFVICPLIDGETGSDPKNYGIAEKKSVLSEFEKLSKKIFPDLRIGYLHGKMPAKEKDVVMGHFASGTLDILVATSVVEVGVNIPNASVMMIEGAERFGLAQLHQFRGRVGRSSHQSYCFLFSDSDAEKAVARLAFFEKNIDGFDLAEFDLEDRGPGDVYGTEQSGLMQLRLASMRDTELIKLARERARGIDFEKFPKLKEKVKEWESLVHLE